MRMRQWAIVVLLIIGLLYVYHMAIAQPGSVKGFLGGLGIKR